ncbi:futalosine hydrolase [Anaerobacillus isosaccharinicus]|uniref:Futalosine hydrolase n=1 Tax=Anaerobacillus isosaccharinicus TaxID=1532552 RepID=A0A1S2LGD1_9BACI|nr:futalosine hydrolase [Anaerobacillus isosaccharinicus]MBA5588688.1 futalosine hydrolase [Anaerobacillus isosaccharinicus]QOY37909.1 futalosine hydrolase [Anaerobacillus isosaccharinicus]
MHILIMTAVEAEKDAVLRGIKDDHRFDVIAGGVGPVSAAISTTKALLTKKYDLVISAGIGGGFLNQTEIGSIVVATEIIAADLGAETAEGFSSIEQLGFGTSRVSVDQVLSNKLVNALQTAGLCVHTGPVLTLATVTGTKETASQLSTRIPGATVEAMEGFGVALAANDARLPILEIRTISNPVGPRDKGAWKIKEALLALEKASSILVEVL